MSLIMKNNLSKATDKKTMTNVVYTYKCPKHECSHDNDKNWSYTGITTCTLSRRMTYHRQNGSILKHCQSEHKTKPSHAELIPNTTIRYSENDHKRLTIKEATLIKQETPEINRQDNNFVRTLKLF